MTPGDTARVLAKAAAADSRSIGDADVMIWHEIIGYLEVRDCLDAVTAHYREQTRRAMPADIRQLAIAIRDRRKEGQHLALPAGTTTTRDRSPEVAALVQQVTAALPQPDAHSRAQVRARGERGRPGTTIGKRRRPEDRAKPPKDWPEPATDAQAQLATRYLLDGHDPKDVADRLGISRRWCYRTARKSGASPEAAAQMLARAALNATKETTDDQPT